MAEREFLEIRKIRERSTSSTSSRAPKRTHEDILVVNQPVRLSLADLAPSVAVSVRLVVQGEVEVSCAKPEKFVTTDTFFLLKPIPDHLSLLARTYSDELRDRSVEITFLDDNDKAISVYSLLLTALRICLDVDADRDGVVEENHPHKADWKWGADGYGAILLVNSDRDIDSQDEREDSTDYRMNGLLDLKDCSLMVIRQVGPRYLPSGCKLRLSVDRETARRIRVFDELERDGRELIGSGYREATIRDYDHDTLLAVEGLRYRDRDFDGQVAINLTLYQDERVIYTDKVLFHVAPWIMTPSTLGVRTVYVSRLSSGSNQQFIEDLRKVVGQAGAQLKIAPPDIHREDRWMQDEIEIGYTQAPGHLMYVVFDSPRNRGLDDFPEIELLGLDFGYVTRESGERATKLDSFGNLEVSPPVTVNGVEYPLGRIIFGGTRPEIIEDPRRMLKVVRDFLYGQKVQSPIEIFADWLSVGHIDEFMSFVPAPTSKGFKLLLASPEQCFTILKQLQQEGHGEVLLREGKRFSSGRADLSISDILSDLELAEQNDRFQEHINWNREILKQELGLSEEDIIDLPVLFEDDGYGRAETFFPDMVNMIVLNQHLGIPKPFGPKINGDCQFEAYVRKMLEPLGLICHFIDDWDPYFRGGGEIHCGTNTRRQPFSQKWWELDLSQQ